MWECIGDNKHSSSSDGIRDLGRSDLLSSSDSPTSETSREEEGGSKDREVELTDEAGDVNSGAEEGLPVREVKERDPSLIRDQQSTGRKRAAVMYPIDKTADCEWKKKKNCGGGSNTITGCKDGLQQARHHGPDKNTLNNDAGNVHRICHNCHNRWHTLNDPGYKWGSTYAPHSPERATIDDLIDSAMFWHGRKVIKVKEYTSNGEGI